MTFSAASRAFPEAEESARRLGTIHLPLEAEEAVVAEAV